jgi:hypothetical protein
MSLPRSVDALLMAGLGAARVRRRHCCLRRTYGAVSSTHQRRTRSFEGSLCEVISVLDRIEVLMVALVLDTERSQITSDPTFLAHNHHQENTGWTVSVVDAIGFRLGSIRREPQQLRVAGGVLRPRQSVNVTPLTHSLHHTPSFRSVYGFGSAEASALKRPQREVEHIRNRFPYYPGSAPQAMPLLILNRL